MDAQKTEGKQGKTIYSEDGHIDTLVRKDLGTNKPLVYPPVVIAHITNEITDLFAQE